MSAADTARSPRARRQWRVQRQLDRIAELKGQPALNVNERRELAALVDQDNRREAHVRWRMKNLDAARQATRDCRDRDRDRASMRAEIELMFPPHGAAPLFVPVSMLEDARKACPGAWIEPVSLA